MRRGHGRLALQGSACANAPKERRTLQVPVGLATSDERRRSSSLTTRPDARGWAAAAQLSRSAARAGPLGDQSTCTAPPCHGSVPIISNWLIGVSEFKGRVTQVPEGSMQRVCWGLIYHGVQCRDSSQISGAADPQDIYQSTPATSNGHRLVFICFSPCAHRPLDFLAFVVPLLPYLSPPTPNCPTAACPAPDFLARHLCPSLSPFLSKLERKQKPASHRKSTTSRITRGSLSPCRTESNTAASGSNARAVLFE